MVSYKNENGNEDKAKQVLILVVMEDGLVPILKAAKHIRGTKCLNPCCNGRWSRTGRVTISLDCEPS